MAEQRPGGFPLLVRGDWGAAKPPLALKKKLLCYFQSQRRSGGGECELQTRTGCLLVCFARPEVRQRVLEQRVHELDWGPRKRLSLLVTELPADGDPTQEVGLAGGAEAPVNESQVFLPTCQNKEISTCCTLQEKTESHEKFEAEKATSRKSIIVTTAFGEEIEDEVVEMYFENKKKSGGGTIESYIKKNQEIIITFQDEEDAEEVLQKKHHSVKKIDLFVKPFEMEESQESQLSTRVVLENVQETMKECMLIMLIENISGLSEDDGDFSVEMIPELHAAVVTFTGSIGKKELRVNLNHNHRAKQYNITARCLELTNCVRVENIPPGTPTDYIIVYFENKKNGGAQVMCVQQLPDEEAAIVTFDDHKDVTNILAKQHSLNKTPVSVYPYYTSLGTALYGKEGPQIKKPDPVTVPLNLYIWCYLQINNRLTEAISGEMAKCNCVVTWPEPHCAEPEVTLHPSAALSERKRSVSQLVKTWKEKVSTAFSQSISKYEAIECQVNAEVWDAIRNSFTHDEVMIIPCLSNELCILVGEKEVVKNVEQELKIWIEEATRKIEIEKQRIEVIVTVSPGEYAILESTGLQEKIFTEFPALQMSYDCLQKIFNLCGVPHEVYKVKGEILDNIRNMKRRTVNIHPNIFQFLKNVDNETLSQSLFMSKQISAFYELSEEDIILKGNTDDDVEKAEEEIKKELDYKTIAVQDGSVLQKKEWRILTEQNCSNGAVTVTQAESQVIIAGCSQAVAKAYEELFNFIDENMQVEKVIGGRPTAVMMFVEKEKSSVWNDLQNKGVKVDFSTQKKCRVVCLSGPKGEVLKGVTLFEQILSGLHYKRVVIEKPGAKSYFKERERFFAATANQDFKCLVMLEEESEQLGEKQERRNTGKPYMQVTLGGIVIAVYKADLCTHPADVVVNAANGDLKHTEGLAGALLKAAGPELQQECDLVREKGILHPGCAVITKAGKLPCKNIIHAIGPRWRQDEEEKCVFLLKKTVKKSLQLAEEFNHHSIALPAGSAEIFSFPLELYTYSIVSSIRETLEESMGESSLKEVHLVDIAQHNIEAFSKALKKVFLSPNKSLHQPQKSKISQNSEDLPLVTTEEGLHIILTKGSIEDAKTDVVVNSVAQDLQLGKGPLAKALLRKAGPMLQTGLKEEGQRKTPVEGSVLKTKGYGLDCSVVLHAVVPMWSKKHPSLKVLGDVITKCLEIAEELSLKSITFPAIGTGNLGFPKPLVAKLLFEKVFEFSSKNRVQSLKEVHFVLYPEDTDNIEQFSAELQKRCENTVDVEEEKASPKAAFQDTASSHTPAQKVHEMTIGSVIFQVVEGDITKEAADVIVNITNKTFNLKTGVSKAILNGAGKAVEDECAQASQSNKSFITTQAGSLPCKKIIHFVAQEDIKQLVSIVLQECELQQYTSVTFPAIGTGEAGRDPAVAADNMIEAVTDFARSNSAPSLKTIKVVIFQPHLMSVFNKSMQKGGPLKTVKAAFSKIASFWGSEKGKNISLKEEKLSQKNKAVLEKKINPAVVQICGENKNKVEEAAKWLEKAILNEIIQTEITDESIVHFREREKEELDNIEKKFEVALKLDGNIIKISGVEKDVCKASSSIQQMIYRLKESEQEEKNAKLLQNIIEWKYFKKDSYVPFDSLTNKLLEDAFTGQQKVVEATIDGKKCRVNTETKCFLDDQGNSTPIIRIDKSKEATVLPATWDDMENQRLKIVELKPATKEYKDVQKRFLRTCQSFKIEKIERIQNQFLWKNYQIKKDEMDNKNGNRKNEKLLFHGTNWESLHLINNKGFNRSYAGMHAAYYGNGTYFAVNASYSAQDTYSQPDANGKKYMYLAQVLVGEYSQGVKGSIIPGAKDPHDSVDLFDSSTDNMDHPSMFIIFNDVQAYPAYLITFTK
ncbi:protein mono-ADP-ribosyltransferase PARP14-like [Indicator indicator]|uniref:protein mono-ADP-ribosyltransferase PARP14-like n=1 Tax=Indicator indicator TaxID=1002788 RepID=UPI0023E03F3E|nr:protein mono-ADP-ribosyltransferase PARP14-like [Indicator indicator]